MAAESNGQARDPEGRMVVVLGATWRRKILRDHPELESCLDEVLRAVSEPDLVAADPTYSDRRRHYLRGVGPSRWLMVVVSYEQVPARVISAFASRKDPRSWSR